jgi:hypothetical protein
MKSQWSLKKYHQWDEHHLEYQWISVFPWIPHQIIFPCLLNHHGWNHGWNHYSFGWQLLATTSLRRMRRPKIVFMNSRFSWMHTSATDVLGCGVFFVATCVIFAQPREWFHITTSVHGWNLGYYPPWFLPSFFLIQPLGVNGISPVTHGLSIEKTL